MSEQQQIGKKFFGSGHCGDRGELEAQYAGIANKEALVWYILHLYFQVAFVLYFVWNSLHLYLFVYRNGKTQTKEQ